MSKVEYVYVLRTCNADMTAYGGFKWPEKGKVEAPDWNPRACCGQGLHGLLWGEGAGGLLDWSPEAKWLVVRVIADEIVKIDDGEKVKFPRGEVVFCGERREATDFLAGKVGAQIRAIVGATATAGNRGTATAGDRGTATAGDEGTATAGYAGTATAGDEGTATAGDRGTATAGYAGTATAGNLGTATAGNLGTATAGDLGTATAGYAGTATAGYEGIIIINYWDDDAEKMRRVVGRVGDGGLEPGKKYRLNDSHEFVEV